MPIRAVWFDIGETLVNEGDIYGAWADRLGVPRHTFSAVLGAVLARGGGLEDVFGHFRPGFDYRAEHLDRGAADHLVESDLYPDARRCLRALKDTGLFVGVAGNQPAAAGPALRRLDLPCDVLATSAEWGVEKPTAAFFDRVADLSGCARDEIAYVGDRLDNDVAPAARASLFAIWIRRGPWGYIGQSAGGGLADGLPALTVASLDELGGWFADAAR